MRHLRRLFLTTAGALGYATAAQAIPAATPEQMLCGATHIFVGRVLSAVNTDCRLDENRATPPAANSRCTLKDEILLKIRIIKLLGQRSVVDARHWNYPPRALQVGDVIEATTSARTFPGNKDKFNYQGGLAFSAPYDAVLPNAWIEAAYTDQEFIVSARQGNPFSVGLWAADRTAWAHESMERYRQLGIACPEPTPR